MANILKAEKKVAVISMLAEGASIRSIERITGVNRNTIMSLGVRVGKACKRIMDEKMFDLTCKQIEIDEIWATVAKRLRHSHATSKARETARTGAQHAWRTRER